MKKLVIEVLLYLFNQFVMILCIVGAVHFMHDPNKIGLFWYNVVFAILNFIACIAKLYFIIIPAIRRNTYY